MVYDLRCRNCLVRVHTLKMRKLWILIEERFNFISNQFEYLFETILRYSN